MQNTHSAPPYVEKAKPHISGPGFRLHSQTIYLDGAEGPFEIVLNRSELHPLGFYRHRSRKSCLVKTPHGSFQHTAQGWKRIRGLPEEFPGGVRRIALYFIDEFRSAPAKAWRGGFLSGMAIGVGIAQLIFASMR